MRFWRETVVEIRSERWSAVSTYCSGTSVFSDSPLSFD